MTDLRQGMQTKRLFSFKGLFQTWMRVEGRSEQSFWLNVTPEKIEEIEQEQNERELVSRQSALDKFRKEYS